MNDKEDLSQDSQNAVENVSSGSAWDTVQLKQVLIITSQLKTPLLYGVGVQSIHVQGFRREIDTLRNLSMREGRSASVAFLSDPDNSTVTPGQKGKLLKGNTKKTPATSKQLVSWAKQRGRELFQSRAMSIRVTPPGTVGGIAAQDFIDLLLDSEQQMVIRASGERRNHNVWAVLKTNQPANWSETSLNKMLVNAKREHINNKGPHTAIEDAMLEFQKDICTQTGLLLFKSTRQTGDLMTRIPVVQV